MAAEASLGSHTVDVAGRPIELPIIRIDDQLAISLMMVIDLGVSFGEHVGRSLAERFAGERIEVVVGAATLGIPVAIETARHLGVDRYVILQKSPKHHLADALFREVRSVTSAGSQRLMLDRRMVPHLAGRRVLVVDDVVATGSSLAAILSLVREAGGIVAGIGVVLTEAHAWRGVLGGDADKVRGLGHIPQFSIAEGRAVVRPETL
jgi:adenine phosphoribosyltransferase